MTTYDFDPEVGHRLAVALSDNPDKAAAQLKERLEHLGLTHDHFTVVVEGTTVVVGGDAAVQEQKEKILLALGNVVGVTRVDDRVDAGQEDLSPRFVTVLEGESLDLVAERVYGNRSAAARLLAANSPMLTSADAARPGEVLRAPL
ncbi:BON domain-containing protein [Streptomyces sp. NPDC020707]|jgi:nucleoid-associated protein YgaU|uniref:BON domain-containing protein n=1 Tax=Streptomyces ortus TaxID=2867268 RepID=A0ABT3VES1_9ACTN|nr:BON domain-containing protein [Streptomyces ortus]MCX4236971.1 BON domain-containing protein [Streptomyces ortus]